MTDLNAFSDAAFDPKLFINQACTGKTGDEPLERFLAELEMKLHLSAEDVGLYLQDHSGRAMQRIPAAAKELLRIKVRVRLADRNSDDVATLRGSAAAALKQLEDAGSGQAAAVVGQLQAVDTVKRRMEDACSTLKEAAGLSALFQQVDDHFASGNLRRVADTLAGMRRGLAVVGDSVAEFRGGRDRLARLEERFAAMVEAPLTAAFAKQEGEEAAALAGMLDTVERGDALQRLYCAARLPPLQALWDGYTAGTPFASWLPGFYNQVVHALAAEAAWCGAALPDHCPALPLALLGALLAKVERPYRQRLGVAMAAAAGSVMPLEHLEQVQAAAHDFAAAAFRALSAPPTAGAGLSPAAFGAVHAKLLAPVEEALQQYGDRELAYLGTQLQQIAAKGTAAAAGEAGAAALEGTIAPALTACEAALARCLKLTSGTALPALARVLDRAAQQYVSALQAAVAGMRRRLGEGGGGGDGGADSAEAVLPLLTVASQLVQRLALLEGSLRQAGAEVAPALLDGTADVPQEGQLPGAAALRLQAQLALRQQLAAFAASAASSAALLPLAAAAAAELEAGVGSCVLEVLTQRPRAQLAGLPRLGEWQQRAGALLLPTFSAYPLQYVTSVGEYLMMLPQQLESALLGEDNGEEAGQLVGDWIDKVALDTAAHYQQQLAALPGLTAQGAAQLAADLEYFCNVLTTLGVAVPPSLAAWHAAAAAPAHGFAAVAEAAAQGGDAAGRAAVAAVARLRGLQAGPAPQP
ncbi:hypothetical protein CHLNCDRAFT_133750 [Chlorella variabilis]|uniref:Conserved oligomeric Golgi complex subunit 7 n=1 Tax=Chlorella variabilis TaxID=554065 RepID=E1ZF59_CHLVA|nr:hypothetical protein CHLNCDRAFT_133750 [Chlorella variabilis]EFN55444.1 hypothetical protein CHLNCDRAFT_133750 [Chlorella variabilis]|eukprot:XP_005847546.1 hypothetical protein CHLNCDRAFT_133750 [Chlorella variabilis]